MLPSLLPSPWIIAAMLGGREVIYYGLSKRIQGHILAASTRLYINQSVTKVLAKYYQSVSKVLLKCYQSVSKLPGQLLCQP
jgi:hypothetical protein